METVTVISLILGIIFAVVILLIASELLRDTIDPANYNRSFTSYKGHGNSGTSALKSKLLEDRCVVKKPCEPPKPIAPKRCIKKYTMPKKCPRSCRMVCT